MLLPSSDLTIAVGRRSCLCHMGEWTSASITGRLLSKSEKINNFTLSGPRLPIPEPKKNDKDNLIIGSVLLGGSVFVNVILIGAICVGFFLIYRKNFQKIITKGGAVDMNLRCFTYKERHEFALKLKMDSKEELGKDTFWCCLGCYNYFILSIIQKVHKSS